VGKALLSVEPVEQVRALLARTGMPRHTPHTIVDLDQLLEQLQRTARDGYALDEGEQEVGVRCLAVPVPAPDVHLAVSVSGPAPRMTEELLQRAVPLLRRTATALARDLR
jgi:IclR family acetate operon transcriptional repressor